MERKAKYGNPATVHKARECHGLSCPMCLCSHSLLSRFNTQPWQSISMVFSMADHTLPTRPEPVWQKIDQSPLNGTTQTVDIEEEGLRPTVNGQWVKKIKHLATPPYLTNLLNPFQNGRVWENMRSPFSRWEKLSSTSYLGEVGLSLELWF